MVAGCMAEQRPTKWRLLRDAAFEWIRFDRPDELIGLAMSSDRQRHDRAEMHVAAGHGWLFRHLPRTDRQAYLGDACLDLAQLVQRLVVLTALGQVGRHLANAPDSLGQLRKPGVLQVLQLLLEHSQPFLRQLLGLMKRGLSLVDLLVHLIASWCGNVAAPLSRSRGLMVTFRQVLMAGASSCAVGGRQLRGRKSQSRRGFRPGQRTGARVRIESESATWPRQHDERQQITERPASADAC